VLLFVTRQTVGHRNWFERVRRRRGALGNVAVASGALEFANANVTPVREVHVTGRAPEPLPDDVPGLDGVVPSGDVRG
jgi:hypothetical protein